MQRLKSNIIGIDKGSAALFSDYDTQGPMWVGEGEREHRTYVSFSETFKTPPTVHVAMEMWDTQFDRNQRVELLVNDVSTAGFTIVFKTWSDTRIARARASWMAIGELKDDDIWDIP